MRSVTGSTGRSLLSRAALSNTALIWWAPAAIASTVLTMPYRLSVNEPASWVIAIGVQVLFSAVVIAGRIILMRSHVLPGSWAVLVIVLSAGALRGLVLVVASARVADLPATGQDVLLRAMNSSILALLGLAVLGVIIQFTRDYRVEYALLHERALRLKREASQSPSTLSDATIAGWVGVQRSLRSTADSARAHLGRPDASAESLRAAARVIGDALADQVRPISQGLWVGSGDRPPRLRVRAIARMALRPWHPPLTAIVVFALLVGLGAVNRAGIGEGGVFALYMGGTFAVIVAVSAALGARFPTSCVVGAATLLLTPVMMIAVSSVIGQQMLRAREDTTGAVITGLAAAIVLAGTTFVRRLLIEREALLDELQARIDVEGITLLTQRAEQDEWRQSLGTFVHHSVQSELTALRMQLMEAATADDPGQRTAVRADALQRFDRLVALQPPWAKQRHGRDVVHEVAGAWSGIAHVQVSATDAGTQAQWEIAGLVVEEGVANAVRSGHARNVTVSIRDEAGQLVVDVEDDGDGLLEPSRPGIGTSWLDRVAPGAWRRTSSDRGTHLTVCIR